MKNWIRFLPRRSYANAKLGSTSNNSIYHKYTRTENILPIGLPRTASNSLHVGRLAPHQIHQQHSDIHSQDVPVSKLLSGLNSRLAEFTTGNSIDEIIQDLEVHSRLIQCILRLPQFTSSEILDYIDSLLTLQSKGSSFKKHKTIKRAIKSLDYECSSRSYKMDLQTVLPIMMKFTHLARNKSVFFNNIAKQHRNKLHKQPVDIFTNFVKILNKHRSWRSTASKPYEIEYYLEQNFEKLNIEQITTITHVLIQMKKSIVSFELKKKLFLYVTNNIDTTNHRQLYYILKLFCAKESFTINMTTFTPEFLHILDTFETKFDIFPLDCVALIGMLTTKFLVNRPGFLDKLYSRFLAEGASAHKCTIDYILYTLIFFNYRCGDQEAYSKLLQIITSDFLKPVYKHTKRYIRLISLFCNVGVYNHHLMNEILDEKYLRKTYDGLNRFSLYPYPIVIDHSIQIECPDYFGHRLDSKLRDDLLQCYDWNPINPNHHSLTDCCTDQYQLTNDKEQFDCRSVTDLPYCNILKEISSKLNELYEKKITRVGYLLPHMPRPNLMFCVDDDSCPQTLDHLDDSSFVKWDQLDFQYKWYVMTVLIRNTFLTNFKAVPLGSEITKIRQLKKLNFNVISVVQDEWLSMSEEQKTKFCTTLI